MERPSFERPVSTERITSIEKRVVEPGVYSAKLGFRSYRGGDNRFFYAGNEEYEDKKKPFNLDTNSTSFLELERGLRSELVQLNSFRSMLDAADAYVQKHVVTNLDGGVVHSLSDIIRLGRGVCAGKSALVGCLLQKIIPTLEVTEVSGVVGPYRSDATYPFGHAWLRIKMGNKIGLLDPFYHRSATYESEDTAVYEESDNCFDFSSYTVGVEPVMRLMREIKVEATRGFGSASILGAQETWLMNNQAESLVAQVDGYASLTLKAAGGSYDTVRGEYLRAGDPQENGPLLTYPLQLSKI
jgi:hypothetical protein